MGHGKKTRFVGHSYLDLWPFSHQFFLKSISSRNSWHVKQRHKNVYCFKHHEKNNYSRVIGCHGPTASHNQPVLKLVHSPTGAAAAAAAGGGAAPDLFQGPDTLSPLTRIISPSSPTSSFSYSSSSFSSLKTNKQKKKTVSRQLRNVRFFS